MEICNEVAGSYEAPSNKNIIKSMRSIKASRQYGSNAAKIQKISEYLKNASNISDRSSSMSYVLSNVYKVHEMHTKASIVRERKLRRSMRLSMIHPSNITDGNYNS